MIDCSTVFTPNDIPTITYVGRSELQLEEKLSSYIQIPKMVVSLYGPSKSGKTVLIKKKIDSDYIIPVIGSGINSPDDLWNRILQWINSPTTTSVSNASGTTIGGSVGGSGSVGVPLIAQGEVAGELSAGQTNQSTTTKTLNHSGLPSVIREISNSEFVIFIDDFHYIDPAIQEEVGRQIKVAAENGVKIITASIPHRSDDVVRSNPELRGRVAAIDLGYWNKVHLLQIATQGFNALNIAVSQDVIDRLADESMGSPQLMQTICYCLCRTLRIYNSLDKMTQISVSNDHINDALFETSHFTDFSKMLSALHDGPRSRGQERKEYNLSDGSCGDVYRVLLLSIRSNPISMSFSYDEIMSRVRNTCVSDSPAGSSVTSCLEQMKIISENVQPGKPVIAWDGDRLDVTDPYFAFFLRCSDKLLKLA